MALVLTFDENSELENSQTQVQINQVLDENPFVWVKPPSQASISSPILSQDVAYNECVEETSIQNEYSPNQTVSSLLHDDDSLLSELFLKKKRKFSVLKQCSEKSISQGFNSQSETPPSTPSTPSSSSPSTPSTPTFSAPSTPPENLDKKRTLPKWMFAQHTNSDVNNSETKMSSSDISKTFDTTKVTSKPNVKKIKSSSFDNLKEKSVFPIRLVVAEMESSKIALYITSFDKTGVKYATCFPPLPDGESDWSIGGVKRIVTFHPTIYSALTEVVESTGEIKQKLWKNKNMPLGLFTDIGELVRGYIRNDSSLVQILSKLPKPKTKNSFDDL
jgi:hypothetical protein